MQLIQFFLLFYLFLLIFAKNSNLKNSKKDDSQSKDSQKTGNLLMVFDNEENIDSINDEDEEFKFDTENDQKSQVGPFEEFVAEKSINKNLDEKAEKFYQNALDKLARRRSADLLNYDIRSAYSDLETAARLNHPDAEKILAFSYLFGDYRWSMDEARQIFEKLSAKGSVDAHLGLGFFYSTGVGIYKPNPAKGFLHYTFAALGGNSLAQMALGYRYGFGVSTTQSCETALMWYEKVAKKVASKVKILGNNAIQKIRIPDELEIASSTIGTILDNNVFSYYKFLAESGDMQAMIGLAQLYLTGSKGVPLDLEAAAKYFKIAAAAGNAQAHAYLGKMYLEGTPITPQNNFTALYYFKKAADQGNAVGQNGLGILYLYGYGVDANPRKAIHFFSLASKQGLADAQVYLGQIYLKGIGVKRDFNVALNYYQLASQSGNLLAVYNLAKMYSKGLGVFRNCPVAMNLYKNVAERGRWSERFMDAFSKFQNGAVDEAAFRYLFLAEFGYEIAQTNFAYIIDQEKTHLFTKNEGYKRAIISWQRAANQDYALARVKLGDYKYYGLGTEKDLIEAANHYKIAAKTHNNAQAMFNLGYMHEHGLGVHKDLHLAKRYYDQASATSIDAFVPVILALTKLHVEFFIENYFLNINYNISDIPLLNLTKKLPSLKFLDTMLGPDWDLYLMSLLFGLVIWLVYYYLRNLVYVRLQNQQNTQNRPTQ